jgi:hypothetical protein
MKKRLKRRQTASNETSLRNICTLSKSATIARFGRAGLSKTIEIYAPPSPEDFLKEELPNFVAQ